MVLTYKQQFNKKYKFPKDEPHSLAEIAKITGYKLSGLQTIFDKGIGAYKNQPTIREDTGKKSRAVGVCTCLRINKSLVQSLSNR